MPQSDWFRRGQMFPLDQLRDWENLLVEGRLRPLWPPDARLPDPTAWLIRRVLTLLKPAHAEVLENKYFLGMSDAEIAAQRGTSARAVRGLTLRAKQSFMRIYADELLRTHDIPGEEL